MSIDTRKDAAPIRLVFELARADHPHLYDDLIRFHKGTKRVNRLRVLAYDGLLAQSGLFVGLERGLPTCRRELTLRKEAAKLPTTCSLPRSTGDRHGKAIASVSG